MTNVNDFWRKHKLFNATALIKDLQEHSTNSSHAIVDTATLWPEAIQQYINSIDPNEAFDLLARYGYDYEDDNYEPALENLMEDLKDDTELQADLGNYLKVTPTYLTVFEFHAVTPELAEWLMAVNEIVFESDRKF